MEGYWLDADALLESQSGFPFRGLGRLYLPETLALGDRRPEGNIARLLARPGF